MKHIMLTALALGLAGCATPKPVLQTAPVSIPPLGTQSTKHLGEQLLMQAEGVVTKAIELGGADGMTTNVPAGIYCNTGGDTYVATGNIEVGVKNSFGDIILRKTDLNYDGKQVCANGSFSCYTPQEISITEIPNKLCVKKDSFQQVIEFNGKSGDTLNFTYREFTGGMARSAFTANFTMDLNEGDELVYKGAGIKDNAANNKQITYTVLKNFNTL